MCELVVLAFSGSASTDGHSRVTTDAMRTLVADPQFRRMTSVTLVFVAASVVLQLAIGIALAWLIDAARRRVRGTLAARAAVVSAWVMPGVLAGVIWKILLIENRAGVKRERVGDPKAKSPKPKA